MTKLRCQSFQTAVGKFAEFIIAFQGHLCRTNRIINRRLNHDVLMTGHRRFKGDIVCDFDDIFVCEKCL